MQGLGGSRFRRMRGVFRQELKKPYVGPIDVLVIQEHHLGEQRLLKYGNLLPGKWQHFWLPAFGPNDTQGGLCIAVSHIWASRVSMSGALANKRAQYVVFQIGEIKWGLLNLYAPNSEAARSRFWTEILSQIPQIDHWALVGDFNMLEDVQDRQGGSLRIISGAEFREWERLCMSLGLVDLWSVQSFSRLPESLSFSRSDRRIAGVNLSRLDRFYGDAFMWNRGGQLGIIPGCSFSDHSPLRLKFFLSSTKRASRFRIPNSVFLREDCKDVVQGIWSRYQYDVDVILINVVQVLKEIQDFFQSKAKALYLDYDSKIGRYKRAMTALQHLQQRWPGSVDLAARIIDVGKKISDIQLQKSDFWYHKSVARWIRQADTVCKEFFQPHRNKSNKSQPSSMRRVDGSLTSDVVEMRDIASTFYRHLLSANPIARNNLIKRDLVWDSVSNRVSVEMQIALLAPLQSSEVLLAAKALGKDVCPGVDGMGVSWYIEYWDLIGNVLTSAYQQIIDHGYMPQEWTEGLIYLIPKGDGPLDDIRKWRPITLLNVVYKILAKTIARRVQPFLPQLIHDSQTGFVQERSIFDNIFLFWEMVAFAEQQQDLAILFLDFEKAYDRVDWDFMEGTLMRMGFPMQWIRAVAALYRTAHSSLLFAGDVGCRFSISRSVRQGCPLAPFLFILVSEAFSDYLRSRSVNIHGIALPIQGYAATAIDSEFADDTALYISAEKENLLNLQQAVTNFCDASGALINWDKSMGFWVASTSPPQDVPTPGFSWVPRGKAVRYLGCQVGLDLSAEDMVAPLLLRVRNKLLYWDTTNLSLPGRVVVANSVLLASIWYVASTWLFSRSIILKLQRLVRNFIWGASLGSRAVAKVSWSVLIRPISEGGLGLIDPMLQSKALLAKHVVRAFMPGDELWKKLWLWYLSNIKPTIGGQWQDSFRWLFNFDFPIKPQSVGSRKFFTGILRAWKDIREALLFQLPSTEVQFLRQPLLWNPLFTDNSGCVLGIRPHLSWGKMDLGPAATVADWERFQLRSNEEKQQFLSSLRGGCLMTAHIQQAFGNCQRQINLHNNYSWYGLFSPLGILLGARAYTNEDRVRSYEVGDAGFLYLVEEEDELMQLASKKPIRVIARLDKKIFLDPSPFLADHARQLWAFKSKPVEHLKWDPADYAWLLVGRTSINEQQSRTIPFFQYSVAYGRRFLLHRHCVSPPAAQKYWESGAISSQYLVAYWKNLWALPCLRRAISFKWLFTHYALPVGFHLKGQVDNRQCVCCQLQEETLKHLFWTCSTARKYWGRILRMFSCKYRGAIFTWGAVFWGSLDVQVAMYEGERYAEALRVSENRIEAVVPNFAGAKYFKKSLVWNIVSINALWVWWKCRCSKKYEGIEYTVVDMIKMFWDNLVHTVKGEYDNIKGTAEKVCKKRRKIRQIWYPIPLWLDGTHENSWNYMPPRWLFPPPSPFLFQS